MEQNKIGSAQVCFMLGLGVGVVCRACNINTIAAGISAEYSDL